MDNSSFPLAGPSSQYTTNYTLPADLAATVSPASLSFPSSSRSSQFDPRNGYRPVQQPPQSNASISYEPPDTSGSSLKRAYDLDQNGQVTSSASPPASTNAKRAKTKKNSSLVQPHQDLNEFLEDFWTRQVNTVEEEDVSAGYALPLARIKKVMKSDEDVRMISAEVPIMFSKACEIFISELTCRAWLVAEGQKRRTLQKSDVAAAIAHSDMFDFLIDIVPREDEEGGEAEVAAAEPDQDAGDDGGEGDEGEVEEEEV